MADPDPVDPQVMLARSIEQGFAQVNKNLRLSQLANEEKEYDGSSAYKYRPVTISLKYF